MKLRGSLIEVKEVGFIPKKYNFSGLASSYDIDPKLRQHESYLVGLVVNTGVDVTKFKELQVLAYHKVIGVGPSIFEGSVVIAEENVLGEYTGLVFNAKKGYTLNMEKFGFIPNGDRLLARELKDPKKSKLSVEETKPYARFEVVQVGTGTFVSVGDVFVAAKNGGIELEFPEENLFLFHEKSIYGKDEKK